LANFGRPLTRWRRRSARKNLFMDVDHGGTIVAGARLPQPCHAIAIQRPIDCRGAQDLLSVERQWFAARIRLARDFPFAITGVNKQKAGEETQ
jgi:hypothetical protein